MKTIAIQIVMIVILASGCNTAKNNLVSNKGNTSGNHDKKGDKSLFIDVHHLGAGNVTYEAVMEAHKKDLEVQDRYDVHFIKFWLDEKNGTVTCLSEARSLEDVVNTHRDAHGLLPDDINPVKQGD
jgi:hypothetical protein